MSNFIIKPKKLFNFFLLTNLEYASTIRLSTIFVDNKILKRGLGNYWLALWKYKLLNNIENEQFYEILSEKDCYT